VVTTVLIKVLPLQRLDSHAGVHALPTQLTIIVREFCHDGGWGMYDWREAATENGVTWLGICWPTWNVDLLRQHVRRFLFAAHLLLRSVREVAGVWDGLLEVGHEQRWRTKILSGLQTGLAALLPQRAGRVAFGQRAAPLYDAASQR
jgi:hypothetical protein